VYDAFGAPPEVREVPDPAPSPDGVVVRVEATGLCRSDWHAWAGHDSGVRLPHVPGHELAGTVHAVGARVRRWRPGDRVTVPFVCGCGSCELCRAGEQQVCPHQTQPGFTHWGSFAELVALDAADVNLIGLPGDLAADAAAGLGCRVATAFRAVLDQGRARPGEWVAVHGCGGVGLSAVMIAVAAGARVVAVDVDRAALDLAPLPMHLVVAHELELLGSHGMPAHDYPRLLAMVASGLLRPDLLVTTRLGLGEAGPALTSLDGPGHPAGISVVDPRR
jgi:D-arabinose 1-dehydrogenase-like Zn-dependent alcohol dehydrogenase